MSRALSKSLKISLLTTGLSDVKRDLAGINTAVKKSLNQVNMAAEVQAAAARRDARRAANERRRDISESNRQVRAAAQNQLRQAQQGEVSAIRDSPAANKLAALEGAAKLAGKQYNVVNREIVKSESALQKFLQTSEGVKALSIEEGRKAKQAELSAAKGGVYSMPEVQELQRLQDQVKFLSRTGAKKAEKAAARQDVRSFSKSDAGKSAHDALIGLRAIKEQADITEKAAQESGEWQRWKQLSNHVGKTRSIFKNVKTEVNSAKQAVADFWKSAEGQSHFAKLAQLPSLLRQHATERRGIRQARNLPGMQKFDEAAYRAQLDSAQLQSRRELMGRVAGGGTRGAEAAKELNERSRALRSANRDWVGLAKATAYAGAALTAYKAVSIAFEGVQTAVKLESITAAFETFTGSAENAQNIMQRLIARSTALPVALTESLEASRVMFATGTPAAQWAGDLDVLTEVAAGSAQSLSQIAAIYGEIRTKGRIFREDVLQFSRRGIPIMEELAKMYKADRLELNQMVSDGKISFEVFRQALTNLTSEGGRFNGMLERMGETSEGQLTKMSNAFTALKAELGGVLLAAGELSSAAIFGQIPNDATAAWQPFIDQLERISFLLRSMKEAWSGGPGGPPRTREESASKLKSLFYNEDGSRRGLLPGDRGKAKTYIQELARAEDNPTAQRTLQDMSMGMSGLTDAQLAKYLKQYLTALEVRLKLSAEEAEEAERIAATESKLLPMREAVNTAATEVEQALFDQANAVGNLTEAERAILAARRQLNAAFDAGLDALNEETNLTNEEYQAMFDALVDERLSGEERLATMQRMSDAAKERAEQERFAEDLQEEAFRTRQRDLENQEQANNAARERAQAFQDRLDPEGAAARNMLDIWRDQMDQGIGPNAIAGQMAEIMADLQQARTEFSPFQGDPRSAHDQFQSSILKQQDSTVAELRRLQETFNSALEIVEELNNSIPEDWPNIIVREVSRLNGRAG